MKLLCLPLVFLVPFSLNAQKSSTSCARETIENSIRALGGRDALTSIQNLKFNGYGYRNALEQSERFEGPYIPSRFSFSSLLDFKDTLGQYRIDEQVFTFESKLQYLIDRQGVAMRAQEKIMACPQDQTIVDDLHLNPLLICLKAETDPSLRCLPDSVIYKVAHKRFRFFWNQHPVTVSINSNTGLPTCIEIVKPYSDSFMNVWGDTKKVIHYSFWELLGNGVPYPRQKDVFFLDRLWESTLITRIDLNQPVSTDSLRIPVAVHELVRSFGRDSEARIQKRFESKVEIAKDIWLLPGSCNSTIIRQDDGLVILESPNTSTNMDLIIEEAHKLFPGVKVKSFITTSDAWLHCGGVRSAAVQAEVVALKENKEIVERLLKANYVTNPDRWQQAINKKPSIRYVDRRTVIGSGINRIELIPYRTEAGERMMMTYFPELKLLYASDLLQPGNWEKSYTVEVIKSVQREKLNVESIYAMHLSPKKYVEIVASMRSYLPN